jgi:hypothetical protein
MDDPRSFQKSDPPQLTGAGVCADDELLLLLSDYVEMRLGVLSSGNVETRDKLREALIAKLRANGR